MMTGKVFYIDDEPELVSIGELILSTLGYEVVGSTDPQKVLSIMKEKSEKVILLITDMQMPQMSGRELINEARLLYPNLPAIIMTGSSDDDVKIPNTHILYKPLTAIELSNSVDKALG